MNTFIGKKSNCIKISLNETFCEQFNKSRFYVIITNTNTMTCRKALKT